MKHQLILFVILAAFLAVGDQGRLLAQTSKNNIPLSSTSSDRWEIHWDRSDDFNAQEVDWRKWNRSPENFGAWV